MENRNHPDQLTTLKIERNKFAREVRALIKESTELMNILGAIFRKSS